MVTSSFLPSVTVAVAAVCSPKHVERCLQGLAAQKDAPPFEVVVAHDPAWGDLSGLMREHPGARTVARRGAGNPMELATLAIQEAQGEIILLTEDHCMPSPEWVRRLCDALQPGRAAVGGAIETDADAPGIVWAYYFVDFFRYMKPIPDGPAHAVSVCNVGYRRADLLQVRSAWEHGFHEPAVHQMLQQRFGTLWLVPGAEVRMRRNLQLGPAVKERFTGGRMFAVQRLQFASPGKRLLYAALAPALPLLLLGRMARKALRRPGVYLSFLRALPALGTLVAAWSLGEWIGYLTGHPPHAVVYAPEVMRAS